MKLPRIAYQTGALKNAAEPERKKPTSMRRYSSLARRCRTSARIVSETAVAENAVGTRFCTAKPSAAPAAIAAYSAFRRLDHARSHNMMSHATANNAVVMFRTYSTPA